MKTLKQIREAEGMTREELAYKSGVGYHMISAIENGKRNPSLKNAEKIAEALDITVDSLILILKGNQ